MPIVPMGSRRPDPSGATSLAPHVGAISQLIRSPRTLLLHRGFHVFLLTVGGQVIAFAASVLLAQLLGAEGFGEYLLATSWALLVAQIAVLGFDRLAVREVAAARAREAFASVGPMVRYLSRWVMGISVCAAMIAGGATIAASEIRERPVSAEILVAFATVPLIALVSFQSGVVRGSDRISQSQLPEKLIRPIVFLALLAGVMLGLNWRTPLAAVVLGIAAYAATTVWTTARVRNLVRQGQDRGSDEFDRTGLLGSAGQLGILVLLQVASSRLDPLLLGSLAGVEQLALFVVATRLSQCVVLVLNVFNVLLGPNVSRMHVLGQHGALQVLSRKFAWATMVCALGSVGVLLLFQAPILRLFGAEFAGAATALTILCVAQLITAASGPAGSILVYCGQEANTTKVVFISTAAGAAASIALIPTFGANGAALAVAIALSVKAVGLTALCWSRLRIDPSILGQRLSPTHA